MKSPNTAGGVRAFRVTSRATVECELDATQAATRASYSDARFYWDARSNSVQRLTLQFGRVCYE